MEHAGINPVGRITARSRYQPQILLARRLDAFGKAKVGALGLSHRDRCIHRLLLAVCDSRI